jgi:hypothetical protein
VRFLALPDNHLDIFPRLTYTQPISSERTLLKPPSGGFCVSETRYSAGFCAIPVPKPLHNHHGFLTPFGVFGAFSLKTSRLFQNDLQVVMCLIIKALIVRTFYGFFRFDCSPNRQKNT